MACVLLFELIKKRSGFYTFLGIFLMVAVSVSRMYLGGHSLNQVIQGLYLGIALSSLYCYGGLKSFITNLLLKQK
jgi:membrane-associated phospholipid phosphatase